MDETRASEFRAIDFGAGPIRTHYFGLEFFPELRVYKQSGVVNRVVSIDLITFVRFCK